MTQTTNYKRSFSGSMGAGMKSIFGSSGRRFYELEFRTGSEKHRAGETQKVIVDQIELGRDSQCGIRFGEDCKTVSRRHAAIIKDGNGWKLVQLSKTNSTYLNGHKVENEWYLQNGDEIQLSTGGPRIGFLVKEGAGSLVKSIGLTNRLSLFRQQALRPYKRALTAVASTLAAVVVAGTIVIVSQQNQIRDNSKALADAVEANKKNGELIAAQRELIDKQDIVIDSLIHVKPRVIIREKTVPNVDMAVCNPYVYHIQTLIKHPYLFGGEEFDWGTGTGFLLSDGKFITAKHCVSFYHLANYCDLNVLKETGKIIPRKGDVAALLALLFNTYAQEGSLECRFVCSSTSDKFSFTLKDVQDYGGSQDNVVTISETFVVVGDEGKEIGRIPAGTRIRIGAGGARDWAYVNSGKNGGLQFNKQESTNLQQGTQLYILGYPNGWGKGNPILSTAVCSQTGLSSDKGFEGMIMASNDNTEGGNSGGPIFIKKDAGWEVVALVSGGIAGKSRFVPISVIP